MSKNMDFAIIAKEQLEQAESLINERFCRCLGYKTLNAGVIFNELLMTSKRWITIPI